MTREVIVARLLSDAGELASETSTLNERRASISVPSRVAAFTSRDAIRDLCHLATAHDVELVLMDAPPGIDASVLPDGLTAILERSPADVALVARATADLASGAGGLRSVRRRRARLGCARAGGMARSAAERRLTLVGTQEDLRRTRRDASRLLADASLAVQRVVGIETTPLLADATNEALVASVEAASVVIAGLSPRWRREGIGATRCALVRSARPPVVLVHRGPRPGGLAPEETRTRFSWSIEARDYPTQLGVSLPVTKPAKFRGPPSASA